MSLTTDQRTSPTNPLAYSRSQTNFSPPSPPPPASPSTDDGSDGLPVGTSIAIAAGVVVGVALLAAIAYMAMRKKAAKNVVVKELSFPAQLPYAEEDGAGAPPSASAVGAVVPVVRSIETTKI